MLFLSLEVIVVFVFYSIDIVTLIKFNLFN